MSRTPLIGLVVAAVALAAASPAFAQVSFVGDWAGRYHEDQPDRVPGQEPGDFSGIPLNEWLHVVTIVDDPRYLREPFYTSTDFRLEADDVQFNPTPCQTAPPLR